MVNLEEEGGRCNPAISPVFLSGFPEHASCFSQRQHEIRAGGAVPAGALLCAMQRDHDELENVCLLRGLGSKPIWLSHWTKSFNSAFLSKAMASTKAFICLAGFCFISFCFVFKFLTWSETEWKKVGKRGASYWAFSRLF